MIVWSANIDSTKTRGDGRMIPRSQAVQSPKADELVKAAQRLGLESTPNNTAARPSAWWEKTGYILVSRKGKTRSSILRDIAREVIRIRGSQKR